MKRSGKTTALIDHIERATQDGSTVMYVGPGGILAIMPWDKYAALRNKAAGK